MDPPRVGRTGAIVLLVVFLILAVEDAIIWFSAGVVPGIEFFLALLVVLAVWYVAIRNARKNPPT